ncbi:MAG: branched-chain amino acid ABC transporter permease [Burkholderiaceae bacterium]|nr:branched-chain amino acid ABC transporter permease [Burkholderiaceae bacterium]
MFPEHIDFRSPRAWLVGLLFAGLALVPAYAALFDEPFYLTLFGRILIYAIAASSLNLLIGYTGLVSFGHALYLGLGAYAVAIPVFHGIGNGWVHLLVALLAAIVVSLLTGLIVLRTSGMGFIMITLAFAQMFFFLGLSLKNYGGDDGMRLERRSMLAPLELESPVQRYYLVLGVLVAVVYLSWRLVHSRFGYVLRGIKGNERRMKSLGYRTTRFKLAMYVVSACICSIAGFLFANLTAYASPAYTAWHVSGELIVMVVLGGMGTVVGPLVGALALLLVEEWLSGLTVHWMAPMGIAILLVVLVLKQGIYGSLHAWATRGANVRRGDPE